MVIFRDDDPGELDGLEQYLVNNSSGQVQYPTSSGADGMAMAPIAAMAAGGSASSVYYRVQWKCSSKLFCEAYI